MRRHLAIALFFAVAAVVVSGCVSGIQTSPYQNATMGKQLYDLNNLSRWKYAVTMSASGVNSTWDMAVNNTVDVDGAHHMIVGTVGNGMDVLYDVWWNATTYQVYRMHAKGWIGDQYQDRDVSPLQIFTLPDTGLAYYFVPFQFAGSVTVRGADGQLTQVGVFTAADNKGFRVTYWAHPAMPLPVKVEMANKDFKIAMRLVEYR